MPYSFPNNIPDQISNLPEGAQKIWVSTFNSVYDSGESEETAIKAAWAQVKSKYKKGKDGKWVKKEINGEKEMKMKKEFSNHTKDKGFFKAWIPFSMEDGKVQVIEKELGGKKIKYLRGIASNTMVDKEDDQMSQEFIQKMRDSVLGMTVFAEHKHEIEKTLGYVESVDGDEDNLVVDSALESESDNPLVEKILKKIDFGIKLGYSIGGKITKAVKEFSKEHGKTVRKILDGEIYEVSVTAMPAGYNTWVDTIAKSMDNWLNELDDDFEEKVEKSMDENTPEKSKEDKTSKSSSHQDETTLDGEKLEKILDEILERDNVQSKIYDLMWAFKMAISDIVHNDEMDGTKKKEKIVMLANEFSVKIEALSVQLSTLDSAIIDETQKQTKINLEKTQMKTKDEIQATLTKKLGEVADAVLKDLSDNKTDGGDKGTPEKPEKPEVKKEKADEKPEETVEKSEKEKSETDDAVLKAITTLNETVAGLIKKVDKMENPDGEINKRKDEIVSKAKELAKEMGISPDDLDIDFKITEKKKGGVNTEKSQDDFEGKQDATDTTDDLDKQLESATPEERKAALGAYFKHALK